MKKKNFHIGLDSSGDKHPEGKHINPVAMKELGIDFIVDKYSVECKKVSDESARILDHAKEYEDAGLDFLFNVETGNWKEKFVSEDGWDWVTRPDGNHLFMFPGEMLDKLATSPGFMGVMYDELEHSQITRNLTLTLKNPNCDVVCLGETTDMSLEEADETVYKHTKALVDEVESHGSNLRVFSEHVWPVLFHNFSRAGVTAAYKQMKENWSNVWAACALGAARQYGKEMWACLDFWNHNTFPGHSPEELWGNMLFAYWTGVDYMYIEAIVKGVYTVENGDYDHPSIHEYGEKIREFSKSYVPANERDYTHRDYEPKTAIIRFDDTLWGQGDDHYCVVEGDGKLVWKDYLFGSKTLRTSPESEEWLKVWNLISHGWVSEESLSWNYEVPYKKRNLTHRSFCPVNAPIVFDHTVGAEHLGTLDLAFLCGHKISDETLAAVREAVKGGLTVVTSARFAPECIADGYCCGTKVAHDGEGKWVITDCFNSDEVKAAVSDLLGKDDEMVYYFAGGKKVTFKIAENGDEVEVEKNF